MAGHFTHYAVTGYANRCASCILSASATIQLAHPLAHPLNSYKNSIIMELCRIGILLFGVHVVFSQEFFPMPIQDRVLQSGTEQVTNYYSPFELIRCWYEFCSGKYVFFRVLSECILAKIMEIILLQAGIYAITNSMKQYALYSLYMAVYFEFLQWIVGEILGCNYMVVAFDEGIIYMGAATSIYIALYYIAKICNKLQKKSDILTWIYLLLKGDDLVDEKERG